MISTTEIYFLVVLRVKVQDQGAHRAGSSGGLFPWLVDGHLLAVSSQGLSSVHAQPYCLSSLCVRISSSYKEATLWTHPNLMQMASF